MQRVAHEQHIPVRVPLSVLVRESPSFLLLQFAFVLGDERAYLVRHIEKLRPLLLVKRDWESSQPIHINKTTRGAAKEFL